MLKLLILLYIVIPVNFLYAKSVKSNGSDSPWGVIDVWPYGASPYNRPEQWRPERLRNLYAQGLDSMKSCGFTWNRPNCAPYNVLPGTTHFRTDIMDSLVIFMQERNLNLLICTGPPNWAPWRDDTLKCKKYWQNTVERYDGDGNNDMPGLTKPIKSWEICNEPEYGGYGSIDDFARYARISYQAIKSADLSAQVIGPVMGATGGDAGWRVNAIYTISGEDSALLRMVLERCGNYFDIISLHIYTYGDFTYLDTKIKPVLDKYVPGKPVWITEIGCNRTHPAISLPDSTILAAYSDTISEADQAQYLLEICKAKEQRAWLNKIFIFTLQDFGAYKYQDSLRTSTDYWGMMKEDFSHRPALDSVRNFIAAHPDTGKKRR
ncbi:MAG: glycosyl hydrolase [bacterium]|nr:glycosyl hydrolase [bacterium]